MVVVVAVVIKFMMVRLPLCSNRHTHVHQLMMPACLFLGWGGELLLLVLVAMLVAVVVVACAHQKEPTR